MKIFSFLRNNDDGASAVEFAIVLPLFLIFVFGIIEFGIIMYNKALITNASREGTRFGILFVEPPPTTTAEIKAFKLVVKEKVADKLGVEYSFDTDSETDNYNMDNSRLISLGSSPGIKNIDVDLISGTEEYLEVKVVYEYAFLIMHLLWNLIPGLTEGAGSIDIGGATTMRMEYQGS